MSSPVLRSTVAAVVACCASAAFAQASAPASATPTAAASGSAAAVGAGAGAGASARDGAAAAEAGRIAYYGRKFAGRRTASGEVFKPEALTMAHKSLPFGTRVKVTNRANQKSVVVRVNDRGPTQADRVGDVSLAAARRLGMLRVGVIDADLTVVSAGASAK